MQFRLSSLLLVVGLAGVVFGLCYWWGVAVALSVATLPLCVVLECIYLRQKPDAPRNAWNGKRIAAAGVCSLIVASLAAFTVLAVFSEDWGGIVAPEPLLTTLPMILGFPLPAVAALSMGLFAFLSIPIISNERSTIPVRSTIVLAIATVCSIVWLAMGFDYSYEHYGHHYTIWVIVINAAWMTMLWSIWLAWRRNAPFSVQIAFTTLLCCWLFWHAFPWMGESP